MKDFLSSAVKNLTSDQAPDAPPAKPSNSPSNSPPDSPWAREIALAGAAVASIPQAGYEAITQHPVETLSRVAISAGTTFALSCLSRQPQLAWAAGRVLLPAMTVSLVSDLAGNAGAVYNAFADNYNSDRNWDKNVETMKNSVGRFGFDLALTSAAGAGAQLGGTHYFGWRAAGASALPELNQANFKALNPGQTTAFKIMSEGKWRQVDVHLPKGYTADGGPANLLIGLDGLVINKQPGMAGTNGLAAQADKSNFVAVFPHAQSFRLFPKVNVTAWQADSAGILTPGSWLVPKGKFDDLKFIGDVERTIKATLPIKDTGVAGFSEGGNVAHQVAATLGAGRIQGVASVEGTVMGREAPAPAGLRVLVLHGNQDPTIPITGGSGGLTKMLSSLGHKNIETSNPTGQISHYLGPNGFEGLSTVSNGPDFVQSIYPAAQSRNGGEVRFVELIGGKHAWPNRSTTETADQSVMAGFNGGPSAFDVNSRIADFVLAGNAS